MIRNAPFHGKGLGFPLRINPATGGFVMTEGLADGETIALAFIGDRYTIREPTSGQANHISEAILHILFTRRGEHDTLPEFGSEMDYLLFDPNDVYSQQEFETWLEECVERWEKRAKIAVPDGVQWSRTDLGVDQGELGARLSPEVIRTQVPGNLVAPFVTARQARAQEYSLGQVDANGHDWCSRYHGQPAYDRDGVRFIRPRRIKPIPPRSDDVFYETLHYDTWLLISHKIYGDIRFWWLIADCYVQDAAERGEPSSAGDTTGDPEPGTLLRMPSRTRVLMELAA